MASPGSRLTTPRVRDRGEMPPLRAPTAASSGSPMLPMTPVSPASPPAALFARSPRTPNQFSKAVSLIEQRASATLENTARVVELESLVLKLSEENRRLKRELAEAKSIAKTAIEERNRASTQLQKLTRPSLLDEIDAERFHDFAMPLMFPTEAKDALPNTGAWEADLSGNGLANPRELSEYSSRNMARVASRAAAETLVPPTPSPRVPGRGEEFPLPSPKRQPASAQVKRFGTLLTLFETVTDELDLKKCVQGICREAAGLVAGTAASIFLHDPFDSSSLALVPATYPPAPTPPSPVRVALGSGVVGYVGQTGRSLNIRDAALVPAVAEDVESGITRSATNTLLCAPILDRSGGVFGVIQITNKKLGARFTREDEVLLGVLLMQAAVALRNATRATGLAAHVAQLRALAQARALIARETTPIGLVKAFHERAPPSLAAERTILFVVEGKGTSELLDGEDLWSLSAEGRTSIAGSATIVKAAFESDAVINIADATTDSRFSSEIDRRFHSHTKTAIVAPVRRVGAGAGLPLGLIIAANRHEQPFGPSDEEVLLLWAEDMAARLSSIIALPMAAEAGAAKAPL